MKLYYAPGACSLAPHIVLRELGKKFELEKVDLGAKKTDGGKDFNKINSKGYVPTLEIKKGEILTEVSTIIQYLADKSKTTKLLPKFGTMNRYRAMENLNFIASELHKGIGGLFNKQMPEEGRKLIVERVGKRLRRFLFERCAAVNDGIMRARCPRRCCLFFARYGSDHTGTKCHAELDRSKPHPACRAQNEQNIRFLYPAAVDQCMDGRCISHQQRCAFLKAALGREFICRCRRH